MDLKKWRNISIIFSLIAGTLLHFTYEWSGEHPFVGLFSAVNESTWEHLKLTFFPMFLIAIVGYFVFGRNQKNYVKANSVGIIASVSFVVIAFYTYSGIIGENFAWVNVAIFVMSVILGEFIAYKIIKVDNVKNENTYLQIIIILAICFIVFTFWPPKINLFVSPV